MGEGVMVDVIGAQAARLVQITNESLQLANESKNISTRVSRLALSRAMLAQLQDLARQYPFLTLTNLAEVQNSIEAVAQEIEAARQATASAPRTRRKAKRESARELLTPGPEASRLLRDIPFTVIDLETTGLSSKTGARIVEIAVARVDPGKPARIVFDTLVHPQGPVYCTEIHGITDDDVVGAPIFADIMGDMVASMEGTLVGAFNASFDMSFLAAEIQASGVVLRSPPPHVCLMWLRPLLNLGKRCSLVVACREHGLNPGGHRAAGDALASAQMWPDYVLAAEKRGLRTIGDLAQAGTHKYLKTLRYPFYGPPDLSAVAGRGNSVSLKPRGESVSAIRPGIREYWHALVAALVDGELASTEREALVELQEAAQLSRAQIRSVHARVYADRLREAAEDDLLTDDEIGTLTTLREDLAVIGWAP